jgi:hypothetical protein
MQYVKQFRDGLVAGRYNMALMFLVAFVVVMLPGIAHADPLTAGTQAATSVQRTFKTFALAIGGIGMVACLMLGFFGKLNWKWVATGIGVSFGLAVIPSVITWLDGLGAQG